MRFSVAAIAASLLLAFAAPAQAATLYRVDINTAPAAGQRAYIDLVLARVATSDLNGDGMIDDADRDLQAELNATLSNVVTDAIFLAPPTTEGNASFSASPLGLALNNQGPYNSLTGQVRLGSSISFLLTLDGPLLTPGSTGSTIFGIAFYDADAFEANQFAPILTSDPFGSAGDLTISGSGIAVNAMAGPNANVTFTAVPEPATWAMMVVGFGLAGAGLRSRRRPVPAAA